MVRRLRQTAAVVMATAALVCEASAAEVTWQAVVHTVTVVPQLELANAELLDDTAAEMIRKSPTFAELLERLRNTPHIRVVARPFTSRELLGRGQFTVQNGYTLGRMEISLNRLQPTMSVRAIAHELAHAVEVACLPPQDNTAALQDMLKARGNASRVPSGHAIETPFALALEHVVLREYCRPRGAVSRFVELAAAHGLSLCAGGTLK